MGTWTKEGFVTKDISFYTSELQKIFLECFGNDFLLDPTLPQGIFITRLAELLLNADMDGVEAFSRLNPNSATGAYLDIVGGLRGLPRSQGAPEKVALRLTINPNNFSAFTIPKGKKFTTLDGGLSFVTETAVSVTTPDRMDNAVLLAAFTDLGSSGIELGAKLKTEGLGQITDIEVVSLVPGTEEESDLDYRTRLLRSNPVAVNTIEFVEGLLLAEQSIKLVGHNYNDTAEEADSLPPYTTEWMAVPETTINMEDEAVAANWKQTVANIILNNKVPGAPTAGNTTVDNAVDVFGTTKTVKFTIPTKVNLQITATLGTNEATGELNLDNTDPIKVKMADYINNLNIGSDVSYSRLVAPLAADTGFDILTFTITNKDTGVTLSNSNFPIGRREYASITTQDIELGV